MMTNHASLNIMHDKLYILHKCKTQLKSWNPM